MRSLFRNLSDVTVASPSYDILLCTDTLVSDMLYVSELLVPGFGCRLIVPFQDASCPEMAEYVRDGYGAFHQPICRFFLENAIFQGLWHETEILCVPS